MKENLLELKNLLKEPKQIIITTHRSPDGDAMGSSLAMMHILKKLGHTVKVITPNKPAKFLHWMPGNEKVLVYENNEHEAKNITNNADIIFCMDFSQITRIANFDQTVSNSNATKIIIDHHQDPDMSMGDIIFSDTKASSTGEIVYEIFNMMDLSNYINKEISECLYTAIMTDTGSFKYSSTNAKTHIIISKLIKAGAENAKIHNLIYDHSSANRIKLLGYCLNEKLLLYPQNNSAIISLNAEELKRFKFENGDTEGFVNYPLQIEGIKFATFIAEKDGIVKLSLRSIGNFKVNKIAKEYFNGGGHKNAAGGTSKFSVKKTINIIEKIISEYKKELTKQD